MTTNFAAPQWEDDQVMPLTGTQLTKKARRAARKTHKKWLKDRKNRKHEMKKKLKYANKKKQTLQFNVKPKSKWVTGKSRVPSAPPIEFDKRLPEAVWKIIFRKLHWDDLLALRSTSRHMYRLHRDLRTKLRLSHLKDQLDNTRLKNIVAKFVDPGKLVRLDLENCTNVMDSGLSCLTVLTSLRKLNLRWCEIGDEGLKYVAKITTINHLTLNWCDDVTDAGLAKLKSLPNLYHIGLKWCEQVTDAGLRHLSHGNKKLKHVNCDRLKNITDAGVSYLTHLPELDYLNLKWCAKITDKSVSLLTTRCPGLTYLDLSRCTNITDGGVQQIVRCLTKLTFLNTKYINITDSTFESIEERHIKTKKRKKPKDNYGIKLHKRSASSLF